MNDIAGDRNLEKAQKASALDATAEQALSGISSMGGSIDE